MSEGLYQQETELQIMLALARHLRHRTFLDVGAEKGAFAAPLVQLGLRGVLFEPFAPHLPALRQLAEGTGSRVLPLAIDRSDHEGQLHIAMDASGQLMDYFHSLHRDDANPLARHAGAIPIRCRSLDSLAADGVVDAEVGILKIDTDGNDLNVIRGMGRVSAEVLMCEFVTPTVYPTWTESFPEALVHAAKQRGYEICIAVKRFGPCEMVHIDPTGFADGEWGNLIFTSRALLDQVHELVDHLALRDEARVTASLAGQHRAETRLVQREQEMGRREAELARREADVARREARFWRTWPARLARRWHAITEPARQRRRSAAAQFRARWLTPRITTLRHHEPRPLRALGRPAHRATRTWCPPISIVTPTLNSAWFLERTIVSVLEQRYPGLEYVIQDGGSSDGTVDILERFRHTVSSIESAADKGQADAINRGFARTCGEIMAYLNADDVLLPGALHYVAEFFGRHPAVDALYGHRVLVDANDQEIGRWILPPHDDAVLSWADYVPQETLFWRRRIWSEVGGRVDDALQFAIDWDLLLRFRAAGARFSRVPRFLAAFRVHEDQKTAREIESVGAREMAALRDRTHGRPVTADEMHEHLRGFFRRQIVYQKLYRLGVLRY